MYIIKAKYIFLCDDDFTILKDKALVFDQNFKDIGDFEILSQKYPNAKPIKINNDSLILPAFINTHTHLEYSANSYTLAYGDFLKWVKSIIKSRNALNQEAKEALILNAIKTMQKSGTGTIGEISSFGSDLIPCVKSSMRIVFFNEILGQNTKIKKKEFLKRFNLSLSYKNPLFIPALSIHAPYSTHIDLAKYIIKLAKEKELLLSTHFLESKYEKQWLKDGSGKFKQWLSFAYENPKPFYDEKNFISLFKDMKTLFTHCVHIKDFDCFDKNLHSITHCAFSNRLLGKKTFDLKKALKNNININIGTDGLSSNISLSILDELRANLLIHQNFDIINLAKKLILMATKNAGAALNLKLGEIKKDYIADFSVFDIKECNANELALKFLLNANEAKRLFIAGKNIIL